MKKIIKSAFAALMAAALLAGCGQTASPNPSAAASNEPSQNSQAPVQSDTETIELKFANVSGAGDAKGEGIEMFAKLINEKTEGRYHVTVYHDGQLGGEMNYIEDCQTGTLDMASVNFANLASYIDVYSVFDLPYLIKDTDHADKIWLGEVGQHFLGMLDDIGIHAVGNVELGFRDLSNSVRPINSAEDIKGLRIRIMENPMYQKLFAAFGADPVAMSWNEAYTALQQGAIDGQDNPATHALSLNIIDVNKYIAMTDHTYNIAVFIMNKGLWDSLSDADKVLFEEAGKEAGIWEREAQRTNLESIVQAVKDAGGEVTYPDKGELYTLTQSIRDEYADQFADEIKMIEDCA